MKAEVYLVDKILKWSTSQMECTSASHSNTKILQHFPESDFQKVSETNVLQARLVLYCQIIKQTASNHNVP